MPVGHRVAEEQEVAPAELRRQGYWHCGGQLGMSEVVDVVVLSYDKALPLPRRRPCDLAVELENHRVVVKRELVRVGVRLFDQLAGPVGGDVAEAASVPPGRQIGNDLERLAGFLERALERRVVARRHEELMRQVAFTEQRRQRCEEAVKRRRGQIRVEQ